ncbi:DUF86 domain-containing protein [Nodosilinea sp. LEGE 07298]|uniref:HepT-like ribonuclease domain-containing protein n=1 Tax=Nodosilinea sp. LEGE 07298 TaxID=2777970 RepID=UPI00187DFD21|nr:DUF86 domain-containing protein [Nodosilinea sp. LEGE 07298]MBE9109506.1 DUF86 domain-containing protein [Nodosilinea sp. LEGE 07298]
MVRDQQWITDMLLAAQEILSFAEGFDRAALERDRRTCSAVLYEIIVIGEAANRLSDAFKLRYSHIPWQSIVGMRNILAHQYDQVDVDIVWDAVSIDVPELIAILEPLLAEESS